jgi:hypothetical protein
MEWHPAACRVPGHKQARSNFKLDKPPILIRID